MTLTPEKLDELERLAELATPGPYSCANGETITIRVPDGSCLAQMTFLTKRGRRDAGEVAKTARMLASLDPATVRELVRGYQEATRFYHADGTFEVLPLDEVRKRRIESARLARIGHCFVNEKASPLKMRRLHELAQACKEAPHD